MPGFVAATLALPLAVACAGGPAPGSGSGGSMDGDTVRIMSYNIHHGEGTDGVLDLRRLADLIREQGPDLVALQEVDRGTRRTDRVDQALRLAQMTGMAPAFGPFMEYEGGQYGMAVLSRWPMVDITNERLPEGAEPRTALVVRARAPASGLELVFVGIHFYRSEDERIDQARRLLATLEREAAPVILAGDFNSEPGSEVMDLFRGDWSVLDKGEDRLTFPSTDPEREIDFFVVRPGSRVRVLSHRVLDEPVASDHRPVVAEIVVGRRSGR